MKQQLNEIFGDETSTNLVFDELPTPTVLPVKSSDEPNKDDFLTDINYTRKLLHSTSIKAQQLVDLALQNAADGNHARDIEVASGAINTVTNIAEKLIDMNKKYQEITQTQVHAGIGNTYINNQTLNITTSELLKQLRDGVYNEQIDL